jgi:hypothetical protein
MNLAMGFGGRLEELRERALGWAVLHAMPRVRAELLASWSTAGRDLLGPRRDLYEALAHEIERAYYGPGTTPARRAELRRLCRGAGTMLRAAENEGRRPHADAGRSALDHAIDARLRSGRVRTVHQLACGSGRDLATAAARFPTIFFCGSDGDSDVVDFCRRRWRDLPNLAFTTLRLEHASDPSEAHALHADLVIADGGLHYLGEPELRDCFAALRRWCPVLLVSQPIDVDFDVGDAMRSAPRRRLSWSHPYPRYLRDAGWENVEATVESSGDRKVVAAFASDATHALRAA